MRVRALTSWPFQTRAVSKLDQIPEEATPAAASFTFLLQLNFVCSCHVWKEGRGERDRRQARRWWGEGWGGVTVILLLLTHQHLSARHKGPILGSVAPGQKWNTKLGR